TAPWSECTPPLWMTCPRTAMCSSSSRVRAAWTNSWSAPITSIALFPTGVLPGRGGQSSVARSSRRRRRLFQPVEPSDLTPRTYGDCMQPDMEGFRLLGESLRNPSREDEEVVDRSGHYWRVRRQPRAGVRLTMERLDGPGTGLTIYEPGIERPEGYPEELPFMEGTVATVGGMPTNPAARMVIWSEMADARALAQSVQDAGAEEGWEVTRALEELGGF